MRINSKQMDIPASFKEKLETTLGVKNTEYTYIPGNLIEFPGTNINCLNPNKVLVKKGEKEIIVLFYGQYYYDDDAIFIYDIRHKCSWNKLKELMS